MALRRQIRVGSQWMYADEAHKALREAMRVTQTRAHELLTEFVKTGQERSELRTDLPAGEIAHVFRQTVFGTLLIWSLYGDDSLATRIRTALDVLWQGLSPRTSPLPPKQESQHES